MTSEPDFKRKQISVIKVILVDGGTHILAQTQDQGMFHGWNWQLRQPFSESLCDSAPPVGTITLYYDSLLGSNLRFHL